VKVAARQLPEQARCGSVKLSIGIPSPRRQPATEPTVALTTVPEPAPFQAAVETMALRVRLRPRSPSVTLERPRLSTITLGSLVQVRRGDRRT
jgi:hypothetical protein